MMKSRFSKAQIVGNVNSGPQWGFVFIERCAMLQR